MTQSNMDQPPGVAMSEVPGTHVGHFVLTPGTVITEPPALVDALDIMAWRGGGSLFWDAMVPPAVLVGLAGDGIATFWRDRDRELPVAVKIGLAKTAGWLVVIVDLVLYDDPAADPLVITVYINPYESASYEALCRILQDEKVYVLAVEGRTVRRQIAVSLEGALTAITKDFLIDMVPRLRRPSQAAWLQAMARVRAEWEGRTRAGEGGKENG